MGHEQHAASHFHLGMLALLFGAFHFCNAAAAAAPVVGSSLKPLFGLVYVPTPSDYNPSSPGPYWSGDYLNADFSALWGPAGRNDLGDLASRLHINAIRSYSDNQWFNHTAYLNYCSKVGIKVILPINTYYLLHLDWATAQGYITTIVQEVRNHPAVAAWGLSNAITQDSSCINLSCAAQLVQAAQLLISLDPSSRPIIIPHTYDAGFKSAVAVQAAFVAAGMQTFLATRYIAGVNMYFYNPSPAILAVSLAGSVSAFLAVPALANVSLIVTEYGAQTQWSNGNANVINETAQAVAVSAQAQAVQSLMAANPRFLGGFLVNFVDDYGSWSTDAGASYGLRKVVPGRFTTASTTSNVAYRVDTLVDKLAFAAYAKVAAVVTAGATPSATPPPPPPRPPPVPVSLKPPSPQAPKPPPPPPVKPSPSSVLTQPSPGKAPPTPPPKPLSPPKPPAPPAPSPPRKPPPPPPASPAKPPPPPTSTLPKPPSPTPASATIVGASIKPLMGICYTACPSDIKTANPNPYWAGDLQNSDFSALWSAAGRDDIGDLARRLRVNSVRSYLFNPMYNHTSYLDYCYKMGIKVIAPVANYYLLDTDWATGSAAITALVKQIGSHPAVVAWGLTNELALDGGCPNLNCMARLVQAAQLLISLDTSTRPVIVTHVFEAGFVSATTVQNAFVAAGMQTFVATRYIAAINMYFAGQTPAIMAVSLTNSIGSFLSQFPTTSLITGEYGGDTDWTGNSTLAGQELGVQAAAVVQLLAKYPRYLGAFAFAWNDDLTQYQNNFGVRQYAVPSSYTTAFTSGGQAYRVDAMQDKPAYAAFAAVAATVTG